MSDVCPATPYGDDTTGATSPTPRRSRPPWPPADCYQWVQTLTNSGGKNGATSSGIVVVDTTAPTGTITYPDANRPLAGRVTITGTASDVGSFKEYQLEYGAGASPSSWTSVGTYTSAVPSAGPLAAWDTGTLSGVYTLRLTVRENASATTSVTTRTVVLENAKRGTEPYYTRTPFDLGGELDPRRRRGQRRGAPGPRPVQHPLVRAGAGAVAHLQLAEPGTAGKFGVGWSSNLTQYLTFDVASAITTWHRDDGGRVPFGLIGGSWKPLAGHLETMAVSGGEVTITTPDQTKYVFEDTGAGRLKRITNRFGKSLTIVWSTNGATVPTRRAAARPRARPTTSSTTRPTPGSARSSTMQDASGASATAGRARARTSRRSPIRPPRSPLSPTPPMR